MTRLYTAARRLPAGPKPLLVLVLLALLALTGCGASAMKASAPSEAAGNYRTDTAAAMPEQAAKAPEATLTGSDAAGFAGDEVQAESVSPQDAVAQAAPPPAAAGSRPAPAKKAVTPPTPSQPAPPPRQGVVTGSAKPPAAAAMASPLLIYRANLTMAVFETRKAIDRAEKIAEDDGGYLVRRNDTSITVRVPASRFHGALASMMKLGDVLHRDVSVEDVTAQYRDLQIRLKNAIAVRNRLAALLKQAKSVKDALEVERELARVTDQIELMKGKLKLLHELVQFSTITIQFSARSVDHVSSTVKLPFPWLQNLGLARLLSL